MKFLNALGLTLAYIVVLLATYLVHARYFSVYVVLYSAILDAILAAIILIVFSLLIPSVRKAFSRFEYLLLVAIWLLGGYAFAISGPTVLDRSLSFYILEKLQQRGGGIKEDQFGNVFIHEYMPEYRLVDVRLTEQLQSGTIEIKDGCVELTPKGALIASISRYVRANFLPRRRLLMGQYTDALNHPFANSPTGPQGYECHINPGN
jgi:hypothetical protein